jgi:hypothetical protein
VRTRDTENGPVRRLKRGLLRKLLGLSPAAWAELCTAQYALIRAQIVVWTRRRGALLAPLVTGPVAETGDRGIAPKVWQLALAVERTAEHGLFRPTCLVQAIALQRMLTSRGFAGSSVHVGIRMRGRFVAHAWIEYRGAVLGDRAWRVSTFAELACMDVIGPS